MRDQQPFSAQIHRQLGVACGLGCEPGCRGFLARSGKDGSGRANEELAKRPHGRSTSHHLCGCLQRWWCFGQGWWPHQRVWSCWEKTPRPLVCGPRNNFHVAGVAAACFHGVCCRQGRVQPAKSSNHGSPQSRGVGYSGSHCGHLFPSLPEHMLSGDTTRDGRTRCLEVGRDTPPRGLLLMHVLILPAPRSWRQTPCVATALVAKPTG